MIASPETTQISGLNLLRQSLTESRRPLVLKDSIFELTGAWKYFTRLSADQAVCFYLSGYTAMPLAFARHVARVEVLGLLPEEQQLLEEVAAAKTVFNVRFVSTPEELQPPYATIVFMPSRASRRERVWQQTTAKLQTAATGAEEYWVILHQPDRRRLVRRGKQFLHTMLRPSQREENVTTLRPGFVAANAPAFAYAHLFVPQQERVEKLALSLSPDFSAPKHIAVFHGTIAAFSSLHSNKTQRGEHVVYGQRPAGQSCSYLERLLLHLEHGTRRAWQPAGAMRVLPGGKVQVVLQPRHAPAGTEALLKLPLIPYAAARMRENAHHLLRLARAEELSPEQRRLFPGNLAEGVFETQAYFLETLLPGRSLEQLPPFTPPAWLVQAVWQAWFDVQQRLSRRVKINDSVFASVLGNQARRLQTWLSIPPVDAARLQRALDYCHGIFSGRELVLGLVHGDFSIKNILADPAQRRISGVIDWDLADFFSVPLVDVLHFFVRLDPRSFRDPAPAIAMRLVQDREGRHARYFQEACTRFGYRMKDWPAVTILYWLSRQRGYVGSSKNTDAKFVRRQFLDVLELFEREVLAAPAGAVV